MCSVPAPLLAGRAHVEQVMGNWCRVFIWKLNQTTRLHASPGKERRTCTLAHWRTHINMQAPVLYATAMKRHIYTKSEEGEHVKALSHSDTVPHT